MFGAPVDAGHRRHRDDRPAVAGDHQPRRRLQRVEHADHVDLQDVAGDRDVVLVHGREVALHARVGDHCRRGPMAFGQVAERPRDRFGVGDVEGRVGDLDA
jgi:hypothetical protein